MGLENKNKDPFSLYEYDVEKEAIVSQVVGSGMVKGFHKFEVILDNDDIGVTGSKNSKLFLNPGDKIRYKLSRGTDGFTTRLDFIKKIVPPPAIHNMEANEEPAPPAEKRVVAGTQLSIVRQSSVNRAVEILSHNSAKVDVKEVCEYAEDIANYVQFGEIPK